MEYYKIPAAKVETLLRLYKRSSSRGRIRKRRKKRESLSGENSKSPWNIYKLKAPRLLRRRRVGGKVSRARVALFDRGRTPLCPVAMDFFAARTPEAALPCHAQRLSLTSSARIARLRHPSLSLSRLLSFFPSLSLSLELFRAQRERERERALFIGLVFLPVESALWGKSKRQRSFFRRPRPLFRLMREPLCVKRGSGEGGGEGEE